MLITKPKNRIVERIIHDKNGNLYCAYFLVCEQNGQLYIKLIKVQPIIRELDKKEKTFYLPIFSAQTLIPNTLYIIRPVPSPYFFKTFFMSQMTRAPSK